MTQSRHTATSHVAVAKRGLRFRQRAFRVGSVGSSLGFANGGQRNPDLSPSRGSISPKAGKAMAFHAVVNGQLTASFRVGVATARQ